MIRGLRDCLISIKFCLLVKRQIAKIHKTGRPCYFLLATPCHGNLGDQAIVYAEKKLLTQCGLLQSVIEISDREYRVIRGRLSGHVWKKDVILLDGGGNMGTLWENEDNKISEIIQTYSHNRIIVFPQTCFYEGTQEAQDRLSKNRRIYESNPNLTIFIRDRISYDFCLNKFRKTDFRYAPDIVLSIEKYGIADKQGKCLLCFRSDKEKVIAAEEIAALKRELDKKNMITDEVSTVIKRKVGGRNRNRELYKVWKKFAAADLVITDRLHGMIFAAITSVPCLAMDNVSGKISGVCGWLEETGNIKVCGSMDEIISKVDEYYGKGNSRLHREVLKDSFDEIKLEVLSSGK